MLPDTYPKADVKDLQGEVITDNCSPFVIQRLLTNSLNIIYEQKIYEVIKTNEPVSLMQLNEKIAIHSDKLASGLERLCECGMIKVFLVCNDIEYYVTFRWKGPKV